MADAHANFATSLVATAPSPATSGTSLVVTGGEGTRFPAAPFNAVICPAGANATPANAEVVRVTGRATDTLTIVRAQESSSARTVIVGDRIYAGPTAKTLTDVETLATGAIPETIINLKGDILVGLADNSITRKAVGADGTVLTADSAGAGGVSWGTATKTYRTEHSFAILEPAVKVYPGFFLALASGESASIKKVRRSTDTGTATVSIRKNGTNTTDFAAISVTSTAGSTTGTETLAEDDLIDLNVTAVASTPTRLTVTVVLERTV